MSNSFMQLSASSSWVNSSQRQLSNCKWHRKPIKCNNAPGCIHNGTKCIIDIHAISSTTSRITESYCSLFDRRRRMCRRNGCYFDIPTRQCSSLTQAPTLEPFFQTIETASPSKHPTSNAPTPDAQTLHETTTNPSAMATATPSLVSSFSPSLSPSVPPTTPKPTRLSQDYCSKYHNKSRRCINKGCLFDSTTHLCTNGVPTSTPSISPSKFPSVSPQPTETPYRIRMYWEQGYKWQEDETEKWYCWACARCKPCTEHNQDRTFDCVDLLCDVKHYCAEGMNIAVTDCAPGQSHDKSASFNFLPDRGDDLKGGQIQVHNTDLCLSLSGVRSIELDTCDVSKIEQRFLGFQPNEVAMELSPANVTLMDGEVVEQCITNHHHPRAGERIFSETCERARRSDTHLWTVY